MNDTDQLRSLLRREITVAYEHGLLEASGEWPTADRSVTINTDTDMAVKAVMRWIDSTQGKNLITLLGYEAGLEAGRKVPKDG